MALKSVKKNKIIRIRRKGEEEKKEVKKRSYL
jgi:hypothetical protein